MIAVSVLHAFDFASLGVQKLLSLSGRFFLCAAEECETFGNRGGRGILSREIKPRIVVGWGRQRSKLNNALFGSSCRRWHTPRPRCESTCFGSRVQDLWNACDASSQEELRSRHTPRLNQPMAYCGFTCTSVLYAFAASSSAK